MAGRYVTILEPEFDKLFKSEKGWEKEISGQAREVVYTISPKSKPDLQFRIYSSIHLNDGVSRGCGKDAIRVCVINKRSQRGVRKSNRINRVPGWETRLVNKVTELWKELLA